MHRILQRQIKRLMGEMVDIPPKWATFLDVVSDTYFDFDKDYQLLSRSLELSSKEFSENNRLLLEAKTGIEKIVQQRTLELENIKKVLEEKNKYLEDVLNSKNDFIRIANHQLNTPLSIMQNAYAMVCSGSLTPLQGLDYWGVGLKRMNHVVEDFWNVLQFEEKIKYDIQKNNLKLLMESAIDNARKMIIVDNKSIEVVVKNPDFVMPLVLCDIKKINHVVHNLLDNAINYTKKGFITISYQVLEDGGFLGISVCDTGIGFSKEDKEKIGEKFYRSKNAVSFHPNGSGLGFYICKNIIENNNGKMFYESEGKDKGSTFSFTLPIAK